MGETKAMNAKMLFGVLACAALPLTVGCSSADVVRGQSPASPAAHTAGANEVIYMGEAWGPQGQQGWANNQCRSKHWIAAEYAVPQGLSYPQDNMPAPIVQYPYYPVKGPSDFFMQ